VGWFRHFPQLQNDGEKNPALCPLDDFGKLSAEERSKALLALAAKLNALSREDRLKLPRQEEWRSWFMQMTESEKEEFIDATLPTDVTQMIDAFERLPATSARRPLMTP